MKEGLPPQDQWRSEWNQMKTFKDAVFSSLLSKGITEEIAGNITDYFLTAVGEKMEEDPEVARDYMRNLVVILNNKTE